MSTKSPATEAEETRFKFGSDGGMEIAFKRKRPHKENPLQTAQATLPKPVEPERPNPSLMMPIYPNYGLWGNAVQSGNRPERGPNPTVNNHFRANEAGMVVDFDKKKQQMLEGGYMPRGGGPRGGSAEVTPIKPGMRTYGPNEMDAAGNLPGFRAGDHGFEKELRRTDRQKFDEAVAKQRGHQQDRRDWEAQGSKEIYDNNGNPLKKDLNDGQFYNWSKDMSQKLWEEPFKVLDRRFTHETLKSFYKDPEKALNELKEGIPHTKGDLQQDAIRLHGMLEKELYGDE